MITKNALLEIGTEELPTSYIEPALKQIEKFTTDVFLTFGLKYNSLRTYATPVRLVLLVSDLIERSNDITEEFLGPPFKVARNEQKNHLKAIKGFTLKHNIKLKDLTVKMTKKGEYFCFIKKIKGEKTEKLLAEIFYNIIKNILFPKTMFWEETRFKFARPIRNIVALYGKKVVKFKIAGVISSNFTSGLHVYNKNRIKIDYPENYLLIMKNNYVIVNQYERREAIKQSMKSVSKNIGSVIVDEGLIDDITYLVEYPSAILCNFDNKYLTLPSEILTVCMKKNHKCFLLHNKKNEILNYFISIKNGISQYQKIVKERYENVISLRLADAMFFYNNDLHKGFHSNINKLKKIIFYDKLGTIYEKIERVKRIAMLFNKKFNMKIDDEILERAIMLSKVDLASDVVFEYPELQGVMGRIYAFKLNESEDIALSIEQHYWPLSAFGKLPSNKVAFLISLADKIDTLVATFSIGFEPSGSTDPYGLKRIATGFVRMVKEKLPNQDLEHIIKEIFSFLPNNIKNSSKLENAYKNLINFLWQRIENIFEMEGYSSKEIEAVTNVSRCKGFKFIGVLQIKLCVLKDISIKDDFLSIISMFKRIDNIINYVKKQNSDIYHNINIQYVNEKLLVEEIEKNLYIVSKRIKREVEHCISKNVYEDIFNKILEIKPLINNFFEKIMIMVEDRTIRLNRILILKYIKNIFAEFIDFSVLR
ncbi:MAG: glycine--tRNA ligase subunit beta [Endomicrobium sp.]|jgi:glycyl-tRNA synthetase beta chain|nr:glycine--tRNA ligase subunit beta [Endomicrobium sp.]